ncbi:indolepyruvate ferredoxin oxidoreductase family protein [Kerstersia gyiorum]|uniref:indolepyruvate ferredoxin oxidoreductase family protein n=1 Tax=Kerstersia gyiorum TaxID=206506 RepID=UPI00209FE2B8|nr:indolepyruvate ferredoxin oxidoreductase family protein [Kerstersia gyiorum]MCP1632898.1 indolepyruvate ferredoxin oxidoreductase [Kerstersia gyiorum]MCP1682121.1 indolepyruvate ferredoxin oxidoreductase [Kerstersia gyiorum]MCP1717789.1 indolepyruvate ferredoxin oxidoreductase [Kerstersia gyiorum]MCW2187004.1 indolepyruvate ferredoxin oxidoreductase [Kerstersia gyiorum]
MAKSAVTLGDRYEVNNTHVLISGVQALVRLTLVQAERDRTAGLKTGGFVSGYRGSPLGTLDNAFAAVSKLVKDSGIVVLPAVNEELAATAIAGTQQINMTPAAAVEGIFSLWYGKGPGLDRAADAIRHGNYQGSSKFGGVVLAIGDDHVAKSSTVVCYSDETVASLQVPLFYPCDAGEVVQYGLHGFAVSRCSGAWIGLKILTEIADSQRVIDTQAERVLPVIPAEAAPEDVHNRWPDLPLAQEKRLQALRMPAVHAYVRANGLDRTVGRHAGARIGIIAAGKSWLDLLSGLKALNLDTQVLQDMGIVLYKPALVWPLEPQGIKVFCHGLERVVVVEEKGAFLEGQIKSMLYGSQEAPVILGKHDEAGKELFSALGDLSADDVALGLARVLPLATCPTSLNAAQQLQARVQQAADYANPSSLARKPFFCSGCPHNRSTVLPDGSRAYSGIGCHGMAALGRPRHSAFCQMGGEGVHWVGLAPFTQEAHVFSNMGDGTYFHSGLLAIRQAVAARVDMTYKLLYNSAVAMTGGQAVDGELSVPQLIRQIKAEGVGTVVLVSETPEQYAGARSPVRGLADRVEHRDRLELVQRQLREEKGVTVIVYEQMCATEKRRLRKRGKVADVAPRVFINDLVCEGCGDCSRQSNCLSVEPLSTPFGTKRRINQSSCNKDASCTSGFCPSFITVSGGKPRRRRQEEADVSAGLPWPGQTAMPGPAQRILVAGIGGTGVVTVGALLAMSAHLSGRHAGVLDQVGLAQKGGAVTSHITLSDEAIYALRLSAQAADLVLACDEVVGSSADVVRTMARNGSRVVANTDVAVTGDFVRDATAVPDAGTMEQALAGIVGAESLAAYPFSRLAEALLGDAIGSNLMMLGYAWQRGWLVLDHASFMEAVDLNGVAARMNKDAFAWGRRLALDAQAVLRQAGLAQQPEVPLAEVIQGYAHQLAEYQDQAYAERFQRCVDAVMAAEARHSESLVLTRAVASSLYKLMAYKDEYEVARLYTDGRFVQALRDQFEGDVKIRFNLAPPLLSRRDPVSGQPRKQVFGSWMWSCMRVLAKGRRLRGTRFDIFGYTHERKTERRLIGDYLAQVEAMLAHLDADNLDRAVKLAGLPQEIRGFGHVKEAAIERYQAERERLWQEFSQPVASKGKSLRGISVVAL